MPNWVRVAAESELAAGQCGEYVAEIVEDRLDDDERERRGARRADGLGDLLGQFQCLAKHTGMLPVVPDKQRPNLLANFMRRESLASRQQVDGLDVRTHDK